MTDRAHAQDPLAAGGVESDYVNPKDSTMESHHESDGTPTQSGATVPYEGGSEVRTESTAFAPEVAPAHYGSPGYEGARTEGEGRSFDAEQAGVAGTWRSTSSAAGLGVALEDAVGGRPGPAEGAPQTMGPTNERAHSAGPSAESDRGGERLATQGQLAEAAAHSSANLDSLAGGTDRIEERRVGAPHSKDQKTNRGHGAEERDTVFGQASQYDREASQGEERGLTGEWGGATANEEPHQSGDFVGTGGDTERRGGDVAGTAGTERGAGGSPEQQRPSPRNRP